VEGEEGHAGLLFFVGCMLSHARATHTMRPLYKGHLQKRCRFVARPGSNTQHTRGRLLPLSGVMLTGAVAAPCLLCCALHRTGCMAGRCAGGCGWRTQ
jgi:hypothetical protein